MKRYLDNYLQSLSKGQQVLVRDFIYTDRRSLDSDVARLNTNSGNVVTRFGSVSSMTPVNRSDFTSIFYNSYSSFQTLFDRANLSASYREALTRQVDSKLSLIESALEDIEQEIGSWEATLSSTPEASYTLRRSFGTEGLRPVVDYEGTLSLLGTTVVANAEITYSNGLVRAALPEKINEELFTTDEGLQVRVTYTFVPGKVDKIRLEPFASIDDVTIYEMRMYGGQGTLINTLAQGEVLNRTLEYSCVSSIVSRIELDILCQTYNITETTVTTPVEKTRRIVIPARQETTLTGYRTVTHTTPGQTYSYTGYAVSMDYITQTGETAAELVARLNTIYPSQAAGEAAGTTRGYYESGGVYYQYGTVSSPPTVTTTEVPIYTIVDIPEQILLEPYTEYLTTTTKSYNYEVGFNNIVCTSSFYTDNLVFVENVRLEGGLPTSFTLNTDEYLPVGSFVNLFIVGNDNEVIPLAPVNREWTTDVLQFNSFGQASLLFYPSGELYFYKDEAQSASLPINGKYVLGPSANQGAFNPMDGTIYWARYQPDMKKANIIPYSSRVASYFSDNGNLGEYFETIPNSKQVTLAETPYIDGARIGTLGYSPVTVVIDGYSTQDLTNYNNNYEDEFPVNPVYTEDERTVSYKLRGNTIFFEDTINRPVRIFYEFRAQYVKIIIMMGIIHKRAACPVLYSYQLSYI